MLCAMDHGLGDKAAALADFRKAFRADPAVRQQFQTPAGRGGNTARAPWWRIASS